MSGYRLFVSDGTCIRNVYDGWGRKYRRAIYYKDYHGVRTYYTHHCGVMRKLERIGHRGDEYLLIR